MLLYGYSNKNRLVSDYETSSYNVYEAPTWSLQVRKIATSLTMETGEVETPCVLHNLKNVTLISPYISVGFNATVI